jgi:hypothetical protein
MDIVYLLIIAWIISVAVASWELIPCLLLILSLFYPKIWIPFLLIFFVITKINDYKYKKYWNTEWDNKLYECLIWSKFLKEKPKKNVVQKQDSKLLKVYRYILYIWVWLLVLGIILAIIYTIK